VRSGRGTTVRLYLPRSMQSEDVEVERNHLPVVSDKETTLVAEGHEGGRATVVDLLQELGCRVFKAPDAASALTVIESGVPGDLLFADVAMPGPLKSSKLSKMATAAARNRCAIHLWIQ
jgi:DNA-binding NtrC family response regulator